MDSLWPWLAVAGLGVLHGLNPAGGWMLAAAWGRQDGGRARVWQALPPLALGHAASAAILAWLFAQGLAPDRGLFRLMAAGLLGATALHCLLHGAQRHHALCRDAGPAGMALWSFLMASAQGAGLMLVPALAPMCLGGGTSLSAAPLSSLSPLLALALHLAAMLLTTGLLASGACRALARQTHLAGGRAWPALLIGTALLLGLSP